jgi:GTP-binding protein
VPLSLVAIVGAPNVGKSTLFNRLVGSRRAIVTDEPGVTRDRIYGEVRDAVPPFRLVDTGGLAPRVRALLNAEIESQARVALAEASLILFVVDVRAGPTVLDQEIAEMLRRVPRPVLLVANKVDVPAVETGIHVFHALGFGPPLPVSAEHGGGIDELLEAVAAILETSALPGPEAPQEPVVRVALVGRPNVGKSSLLNALLGEDRVVVSETPGTTRDVVDTPIERDGRRYLLLDTAGIRRRGRPRETAETLSVTLARKSIRRADVVVLVVDATEGFVAQDAHIAGYAHRDHKPLVVIVNKWDLVRDRQAQAKVWERTVRQRLGFAKGVALVLASAKTGQRVERFLDHVDEAYTAAGLRVPTPELNRWLQEVAGVERASPAGGRSVNLLYVTQTGIRPPRFVLFCNDPRRVHFSLRRFLDNSLRARFAFGAAPIDLQFRRRSRKSR